MTEMEVAQQVRRNGLYRLYWKDGGFSLASVGRRYTGAPWYAPCNWTSKEAAGVVSAVWDRVQRAELLAVNDTPLTLERELALAVLADDEEAAFFLADRLLEMRASGMVALKPRRHHEVVCSDGRLMVAAFFPVSYGNIPIELDLASTNAELMKWIKEGGQLVLRGCDRIEVYKMPEEPHEEAAGRADTPEAHQRYGQDQEHHAIRAGRHRDQPRDDDRAGMEGGG